MMRGLLRQALSGSRESGSLFLRIAAQHHSSAPQPGATV